MIPSTHTALFLLAVLIFVAVLGALTLASLRKARSLAQQPRLEDFLSQLIAVDRHKLATLAQDAEADPDAQGEDLEHWQVWELVGGMEGLHALETNCGVLIDLACYVQHWYPEALPVAEELRLRAREIQWHIERLRGAEVRGHLLTAFPDYAQRAVATYCKMTEHVVLLYQASQLPGLSAVEAAL